MLPDEVLSGLEVQPGQTVVDGTLGGGGHTRLLAERVGDAGQVISLDRDPAALQRAETVLCGLPIKLVHSNFCDLPEVLQQIGIGQVDAILLDLGMSSDQLSDATRGFSFAAEGPLDLRFDTTEGEPAWRLVNRLSASAWPTCCSHSERNDSAAGLPEPLSSNGKISRFARRANWPSWCGGPSRRTAQPPRIDPGHADVPSFANRGE